MTVWPPWLSWTTTRSLVGSSMARDNRHAYREWEPGLGMVAALVPDVSVFHAPAADPAGNVVLTPPIGGHTLESHMAMQDCVIANLEAFFAGKPLAYPVS